MITRGSRGSYVRKHMVKLLGPMGHPDSVFWLTLSHPIALRVEYLRGPIDFRIAQHVWDDQIHLQNTH